MSQEKEAVQAPPTPAATLELEHDTTGRNPDSNKPTSGVEQPKSSRVCKFLVIGLVAAILIAGLVVLIIYLTRPSLLQPDRPFVLVQDTNNGKMTAKVDLQAGLATYEPNSKGRLLSDDSAAGGKSYTIHELYVGKTYNVTLGQEDAPLCLEASVDPITREAMETPVDGSNAQQLNKPIVSGPSKDVIEKELRGENKVILLKYYRPIRKFFVRERDLDNETFSEEIELQCLNVNEGKEKPAEQSTNETASDPPKRLLTAYGPRWGAYCGSGHGDPYYRSMPRDRIDSACMQHDRCADYYMWQGACGRRGNSLYLPCRCHSALVDSVNRVLANRPSYGERMAGYAIRNFFRWLPCGCQVNYYYCYYNLIRTCYWSSWYGYYCRYRYGRYCYHISYELCQSYPNCYSIGYST